MSPYQSDFIVANGERWVTTNGSANYSGWRWMVRDDRDYDIHHPGAKFDDDGDRSTTRKDERFKETNMKNWGILRDKIVHLPQFPWEKNGIPPTMREWIEIIKQLDSFSQLVGYWLSNKYFNFKEWESHSLIGYQTQSKFSLRTLLLLLFLLLLPICFPIPDIPSSIYEKLIMYLSLTFRMMIQISNKNYWIIQKNI